MEGDETLSVETVTTKLLIWSKSVQRQKREVKGQTPTERKGEQEIGKEQVDVEERMPATQGQRSKGGREFPYKGSNSGKMEQESQSMSE